MRRVFALLLGLSVCCVHGCVLGVGWLPDSSGFVFTTPKGDLVHYDCATKKERVIVNDGAAATTAWPAISPDGKKIALAHLEGVEGKEATLQIVVYTLKGQVDFRSEKLKWAKPIGKHLEYAAELWWSPDGKKLIVHGQGLANEGKGFENTALYDVEAKKHTLWEKHLPGVFGASPIRPDGAGFLLGDFVDNDTVNYLWVDWTGKARKIRATRKREVEDEIPPYSALGDSRWDGVRAIMTLPEVRLIVDTKKLVEDVEKVRAADSHIGKEAIRMRATLASGVELFMLDNRGDGSARVVARNKGEEKLAQIVAPIRDHMLLLSASPNGKYAIVRDSYGYRGKKSDVIHVFDDKGMLLDILKVNVRE